MNSFRLPFPPSANVYWRRGRNGIIYVSKAATEYKIEVAMQCGKNDITEPLLGPVRITVQCYMPSTNRDLGNTAKVLEDALQGYCYVDDLQIVEQHYYRYEAHDPKKKNAHVIVSIESAHVSFTVPRVD